MQLTHTLPAEALEMPSFVQSVRELARNVRRSVSRGTFGLSVLDVDDASQRATAKNHLTVRPNPNHSMRTV